LKILQVITDPDRRGAQVFASDLEGALAGRGHSVETVALAAGRGTDARVEAEILGDGVRGVSTLYALRDRMLRSEVTIAHGSSTGPACALAGGGRRRPFVYRQISDSRFWAPTRARRLRVRIALARARLIVALSEYNRSELVEWIGVPDGRVRVVPNGVPPEQFTVADAATRSAARSTLGLPDRPTIAFVGALVPEKGADRAIEHLASLPADVQLVIAGDGPERASLEAMSTTRAPGRVRFLGSVGDVVTVYHASDVLTFPTRGGDAMPAALIEAGLCGLPVVATPVGAIPEVIIDGKTGVITADAANAFPDALDRLLRDPARREQNGAAARTLALAKFGIGPVAAAYERVLREAIPPV